MMDFFDEKELRRLLYILRTRKANSICGDRDSVLVRKYKQKFMDPNNKNKNSVLSSRRSLSIYSER